MISKLSVEEVLVNLEKRAAFHRDQEASHAQQEVHHRKQKAFHAAELEKVQQSLEAFKTVAASAVELARPAPAKEEKLPPPGRLMVGRLLKLVALSPTLAEPFGPIAVAAESNRRFADRLPGPVSQRTASDTLRRMLAAGTVKLAQKGTAAREALYVRKK